MKKKLEAMHLGKSYVSSPPLVLLCPACTVHKSTVQVSFTENQVPYL